MHINSLTLNSACIPRDMRIVGWIIDCGGAMHGTRGCTMFTADQRSFNSIFQWGKIVTNKGTFRINESETWR